MIDQILRRCQLTALLGIAGLAVACGGGAEDAPTGRKMVPTITQVNTAQETDRRIANNAPTIESVVLRPEAPQSGDRLTAIVAASDPDGDNLSYEFEWTVDGFELEATGAEVILSDVSKGAFIEVTVVARDRESRSESVTVETTIGNRPPVLQGVVLEPLGQVSVANDVKAVPRAFDPDGDEIEYRYIWRVDGEELSITDAVLPSSEFERGDEIVLEIIANDGDNDSEPLVSGTIVVANAMPRITSEPGAFDDDKFVYQLSVEDPDGDRRLRYRLDAGPAGMQIDNLAGVATWQPTASQYGTHRVSITVEDGKGGEAVQSFSLWAGTDAGEDSPASLP
jgi:hypothetical protein